MIVKFHSYGRYDVNELAKKGMAWIFEILEGETTYVIKGQYSFRSRKRKMIFRTVVREIVPVNGRRYYGLAVKVRGRYLIEDENNLYLLIENNEEAELLVRAGFNVNGDIWVIPKNEIIEVLGSGRYR